MKDYQSFFKKPQLNHIRQTVEDLLTTVDNIFDKHMTQEVAEVRSALLKLRNKIAQLRSADERRDISKVEIFFSRVETLFETDPTVEFCRERAVQISNVLEGIELELGRLESGRPVFKDTVAMQVEKRRITDGLKNIQENLRLILESLSEISNQIGMDICNRKWHEAFNSLASGEFEVYLSLNQLLLECIKVSAVSDRSSLLSKAFLL